MKTQILLLLTLLNLSIIAVAEVPVIRAEISVSPEMQPLFQKGGRLILHLTGQHQKEPRSSSEVTIGLTPEDWNPAQSVVLDSRSKDALSLGLEKISDLSSEKIYYQAVYNIFPPRAIVAGNPSVKSLH